MTAQPEKPVTPMWEAMDCPDVTDDPFYADFNTPETLPRVINQVEAIRQLPHMTILRVQSGAAAQVINDHSGHWLTYAGTDLADSLDPTDLFWDKTSMDSLIRMLPAIILDQPA